MALDENLYDILEVSNNATLEEIRKKYKKLALKHHPDKGGDAEEFKKLGQAFETLSDPERREHYDRTGNNSFDEDDSRSSSRSSSFSSTEYDFAAEDEEFKKDFAINAREHKNHYEILLASKDSTQEDLDVAYNNLKQMFKGDKQYEDVWKKVKIAYKILSDSKTRVVYDSLLAKQSHREIEEFKVEYAKSFSKDMNHYDILMIDKSASPEEIKHAYDQLKTTFKGDDNFKDIGKKIVEAYRELSDPENRKSYDNSLETPVKPKIDILKEAAEAAKRSYYQNISDSRSSSPIITNKKTKDNDNNLGRS